MIPGRKKLGAENNRTEAQSDQMRVPVIIF
jgi:hypothetical protein